MNMPTVNRRKLNLTEDEIKIVSKIIKKDGSIRASKPKVDENNPNTGKSAYVWRMVCFLVSPKPAHHCMPCTAEFDLPAYDEKGRWSSALARDMAKSLDEIVNKIVDSIDVRLWHGVHRWSQALKCC
jgi:hypothetical protein